MIFHAIQPETSVQTKKHLFEIIAKEAAYFTKGDFHQIKERLFERDKLLGCNIGDGVAVPQAELPSLNDVHVFVFKLNEPLAIDSFGAMPVDVVSVFLAPEERGSENLTKLSKLMRRMRDKEMVKLIRGATSIDAIEAILLEDFMPLQKAA